jgi:iron complex transport system substrate-binding protein
MLLRPALGVVGSVATGVVMSVAACGSSSRSTAGTSSSSTGAHGESAARFPVTVQAASGATVIRRAPSRVISLSPTATEDLFAIGAGRQVIAVDDRSNYPLGAPHTKLSGFQPNLEATVGYRPDLVVISDESPPSLAPALRKLGVPVLINPAAHTLQEAYGQISELGAATGHAVEAGVVVARMRSQIAEFARRTRGHGRGLSVYDEISPDFYAASSRTFAGQLLSLFGLRDVADRVPDSAGLGYPKLSAEYVVAANPEIVLLSDTLCCGQSVATVARRPGWSQMRAVRDRTVVEVSDDIASRWGPRTVDLAAVIAGAVRSADAAGLRP